MEFGILFTSHPNAAAEPYPHRDVHARVTKQIVRADELGYDYAWVAEHHFSQRIRHHAGRVRLCRLSRGADQAHQDRHRGGDAAARQSAPGRGELGLRRHPDRRALRAGARLRLPQIRVRRLRRRLRAPPRHPGGSAAGADGAAAHQAHRPQGQVLLRQGDGALRAVPASGPAAAPADLPRRLDRALARRRRPLRLRHHDVELDAVPRAGAAGQGLSRRARARRRRSGGRTARAATSTWRAGSMSRRPTPRPSARAKRAS